MGPEQDKKTRNKRIWTYVVFIALSCLFTAELNVVHTKFLLEQPLTPASFILPTVAGVLFGYTLAHIQLLSEKLGQMAYTDALTGIYNRLHFNNFLEAEIDKVKRYGGTLSIIFFDIDHFKKINDQHGHLAGDNVIKQITRIVEAANRRADVFARYGGEEFVILVPSTGREGASVDAERLRRDIEQYNFGSLGTVTCSFGVAEFDKDNDDLPSLISRADNAMYSAKKKGRNCVVVAE